jgi:hypothetical protein
MAIIKYCGQCALLQHNGGICPIFNEKREPDDQGCPKFTSVLIPCSVCGRGVLPQTALIDLTLPGQPHWLCPNCQKQSGHCATCKYGNQCSFETDPSSLPKMIQQETRQGNMISVMTVKNPSRIEITCKKGCPCFDAENGCLKQNGCCGKYKIVYES